MGVQKGGGTGCMSFGLPAAQPHKSLARWEVEEEGPFGWLDGAMGKAGSVTQDQRSVSMA